MRRWLRIGLWLLLIGLTVTGALWILATPQGRALLQNPHQYAADARAFVSAHPLSAPLIFLALYLLLGLALMPVWWLQVLAGYAFGFWTGAAYTLLSAAITAAILHRTSRFLGGESLRLKAEAKLTRLHTMMEKVGQNGLLTVMAVRLAHVLPFAISNHIFALTPIRGRDVFLGTLTGGLPAIAFYVALGADRSLLWNWKFWTCLIGINLLLLVPLAVRFKRSARAPKPLPAVSSQP